MADGRDDRIVQPKGWAQPRGYSNGMLAPEGARMLFVAGQIAWDAQQQLVGRGHFVAQFRQALENVVSVVRAAGGGPGDLMKLTVYVTDKQAYLTGIRGVGAAYRELVGKHFPAMALVEVADLLEEGAQVEIEAVAAIVPRG